MAKRPPASSGSAMLELLPILTTPSVKLKSTTLPCSGCSIANSCVSSVPRSLSNVFTPNNSLSRAKAPFRSTNSTPFDPSIIAPCVQIIFNSSPSCSNTFLDIKVCCKPYILKCVPATAFAEPVMLRKLNESLIANFCGP